MISILWAEPPVIEYPEMFTVAPSEAVFLETKRYGDPATAFSGAISSDLFNHVKDMASNGDMLKEFADLDRRMKAARSYVFPTEESGGIDRGFSFRCFIGVHQNRLQRVWPGPFGTLGLDGHECSRCARRIITRQGGHIEIPDGDSVGADEGIWSLALLWRERK